jgi:hypothetical protein
VESHAACTGGHSYSRPGGIEPSRGRVEDVLWQPPTGLLRASLGDRTLGYTLSISKVLIPLSKIVSDMHIRCRDVEQKPCHIRSALVLSSSSNRRTWFAAIPACRQFVASVSKARQTHIRYAGYLVDGSVTHTPRFQSRLTIWSRLEFHAGLADM